MRLTKGRIRDIRRGILPGYPITTEQEMLIDRVGLNLEELQEKYLPFEVVKKVHNKIDGVLSSMTRRRKRVL